MTLNNMVQAVAAKLKELWPGRRVYAGEMPRDGDGAFFVGVTDSRQTGGLDRRQRRSVSIQVLYFLKGRDPTDYLEWAEVMYNSFRHLDVGDYSLRLHSQKARADGDNRYYQFLFDLDICFVEQAANGEVMEGLTLEEGIK